MDRDSNEPNRLLGGLTPVEFFERHWQKKPLLVRGAIPGFEMPLTPQELAGLACDPGVTSRRVDMPRDGQGWRVTHGPFEEQEFTQLPADGWTLLVQEVDRLIPDFAELLDRFRLAPNWRIDDVMVSFAPDGGGVGPHIDRYDVFLLQGAGRRRWAVSDEPAVDERLVPDIELRVLSEFEPDEDWVLEPGDLLYLPPRFAHEGVAIGDSMTCSIGFRAPDPLELGAGYLNHLAESDDEIELYADPDRTPVADPGEFDAEARRRLRDSVLRLFSDERRFDRWVARFVTDPGRGTFPAPPEPACTVAELERGLADGERLDRSAAPHFAWFEDDGGNVRLYVGSEETTLGADERDLARLICGHAILDRRTLGPWLSRPLVLERLVEWINRGFLVRTGNAP